MCDEEQRRMEMEEIKARIKEVEREVERERRLRREKQDEEDYAVELYIARGPYIPKGGSY